MVYWVMEKKMETTKIGFIGFRVILALLGPRNEACLPVERDARA